MGRMLARCWGSLRLMPPQSDQEGGLFDVEPARWARETLFQEQGGDAPIIARALCQVKQLNGRKLQPNDLV